MHVEIRSQRYDLIGFFREVGEVAEIWITCPDCGQKAVSNRMRAGELLEAHRAVCPLDSGHHVIDLREPVLVVAQVGEAALPTP